jgi:hypothetical protein
MITKRSSFLVIATAAVLAAVIATPASAGTAGNGGLSWFSAIIDWFYSMASF